MPQHNQLPTLPCQRRRLLLDSQQACSGASASLEYPSDKTERTREEKVTDQNPRSEELSPSVGGEAQSNRPDSEVSEHEGSRKPAETSVSVRLESTACTQRSNKQANSLVEFSCRGSHHRLELRTVRYQCLDPVT